MADQDLVTTEEALAFLQKQEVSDAPQVAVIITRASMWMEQMTERLLRVRTFTNMRLNLQTNPMLRLPAWPVDVTEPITVQVGTAVQTVWGQETDGDPATFDTLVGSTDPFDERWGARNHLYRQGGWSSTLPWNYPGPWGRAGLFSPPIGADAWGTLQPYSLLLSYTGGYAEAPEDLKLACLYLVQKIWKDQSDQSTGVTSISTPTGGSIAIADPTIPAEVKMLLQPYARNLSLVGVRPSYSAGGIF